MIVKPQPARRQFSFLFLLPPPVPTNAPRVKERETPKCKRKTKAMKKRLLCSAACDALNSPPVNEYLLLLFHAVL
jgi:hypothetical protein